jgi:hypothetical protein
LTMTIVGLRVSCVIGVPAWSWGRRELKAPFNITRMGNTSVAKRVALSIVRHAGDVGIASGRYSIGGICYTWGSPLFYACRLLQRYTGIPISKRGRVAKPVRDGVALAVLLYIRVRLRPLYCQYAYFGCALRERNASIGRCSIWRAVGGTL